MERKLEHLKATAPTSEIVSQLESHGAVVLDDFLDRDVLARFNAEIDTQLTQETEGKSVLSPAIQWFMGAKTRHITGVAAKSRVFAEEVLVHPALLAVCDEILLPNCANYRLNIAHVLDRGPGSEQQMLHRDELVWVHLPKPHPEVQVASIIALEDFTTENGATRIVPGSHRWEKERLPEESEIAVAEMPAGSAVVYLGSTIHGGGPNTSSATRRRGMHMSFNLGWLRTEENNYLSVPPDVARSLPEKAQALLGYAAHDALAAGGGYLGVVDTRDPLELLKTGEL
ncbi:MAG: phytanoyl-CoA dioxygenase family protein [Myxococcales bacterium]|nr:phytanoyl-CoA dioxygenase family protein [Myxococcales bacterium]